MNKVDKLILDYENKLAQDNKKLDEIADAISKLKIFDSKPKKLSYLIKKKNCKFFIYILFTPFGLHTAAIRYFEVIKYFLNLIFISNKTNLVSSKTKVK